MKQEKLQRGRTCRLWDIRSWTKHGLARGYSTALITMLTQRRKKRSCVVLVKRYWMLVMLLGLCQVQEQSVTSKMMRHVCCGTQSLRKIAQHASPLRCFQKIRRIRCAREHGRSRMQQIMEFNHVQISVIVSSMNFLTKQHFLLVKPTNKSRKPKKSPLT